MMLDKIVKGAILVRYTQVENMFGARAKLAVERRDVLLHKAVKIRASGPVKDVKSPWLILSSGTENAALQALPRTL